MKVPIQNIDSLPSKRLYLSIIADYDTKLALSELIDNAIDNWIYNQKNRSLRVTLNFDYDRQLIEITDNSGGVKQDDIKLMVSPGHTRNEGIDPSIGIFGVGSKRAVVALAQEVKIYTRYKKEKTILIEIDDDWIKDESWDIPAYFVDNISPGTTKIELIKLRTAIKKANEKVLIDYLQGTYAEFLRMDGFELLFNEETIKPLFFDSWSYPPGYEPKRASCSLSFGDKGTVEATLLGGLTKSGDPSGGEYGAYFYCNNRLISRAYKGTEVGFRPLKIGQPHPASSLARILVVVKGPAQLMPWNSSKSEINYKHPVFEKLQPHIEQMLWHYATLSKNWSGRWEDNVFRYSTGNIKEEFIDAEEGRIHLPVIPRARQRKYSEAIKRLNKNIAEDKPWVKGLYEAIIAVNELPKLKLDQNNRISLLLLDSTLEIGFKDYLVNESRETYAEDRLGKIMSNRSEVHKEIKKHIHLADSTWKKIEYFYKLRCDLVHKRASATVSDSDINSFKAMCEIVLKKLFGLNFKVPN